jgi:hypothetical protein
MSKFERVQTVVDGLTGECLSEQRNVITFNPLPPEPAYVKLYIEDYDTPHISDHGLR